LKAFISDAARGRLGRRVRRERTWTSLGCDRVDGRRIARLGTRISWICYAKGRDPEPGLLVTVLYGADWRAAGIDLHSF
jgi:hypothetical protein